MAEINILLQRKKSDGTYDQYYPRTKVTNVEGAAKEAILAAHLADYRLQVPYGTATGVANSYGVLLEPAPAAYVEGLGVAVKINVSNTGPSTLNLNGLGPKAIRKANGSPLSAGNLQAGSIYSLRYNGINFILQGSDSAGNAMPGDVLTGKTFSSDEGTELVGTMDNRGAVIITPGIGAQAIKAGYHNGSGYVQGDASLVAQNIMREASIFGVNGNARRIRQFWQDFPADDTYTVNLGWEPIAVLLSESYPDISRYFYAVRFKDVSRPQDYEFDYASTPSQLKINGFSTTGFSFFTGGSGTSLVFCIAVER